MGREIKTYTLLIDVDVKYINQNPWKNRKAICSRIQKLLASSLDGEVEVSCSEMQHGIQNIVKEGSGQK